VGWSFDVVPPTGPEPPLCVPQGFHTGVLSPSAPASCCSSSSPEFRHRGPSVLGVLRSAWLRGFASGKTQRRLGFPYGAPASRGAERLCSGKGAVLFIGALLGGLLRKKP
jgi:hypothetical protein